MNNRENWVHKKKLISSKFFGLIEKYEYEWHHIIVVKNKIFYDGVFICDFTSADYYNFILKNDLQLARYNK